MDNSKLKEQFDLTNPYEIAKYIKAAEKSTPIKLYVKGDLVENLLAGLEYYGNNGSYIVFGEKEEVFDFVECNKDRIESYRMEYDRRNSAIPMMDTNDVDARIEPGANIREGVQIGKNAVIMMGATINIGAVIGEESMIDMNAVLGARATVGKRSHIGAGSVLAGVLEPPSATPVIVGDDCMIGGNVVVLEGVQIGNGSVVAAGSVVTENVPEGVVVAGAPAKIVKNKDDKTEEKTELLDDLRG
ncbi:2,3,4,5-tetrahydropyridine-2,6-dicarboxylate N-acetyltransferase [Anaerofustis stercorihominis]|uniref:2,3,4,5-tetrahydropyridine-2,6-dicarboxylate N-acetyltransferase n=1 Tax=Anaerofustis stercorihominis TaxID=214853 RepID=UPI00214B9FC7|nr:2,3,4,5-tetrahydropyridine-2,6-dicarboxylate N-acetyltransferase [Anaerofustis stercorihominis]MCR2033063.1 2,3,4,5-tetrahydropyridine-2,6-dicarboxylate N-acetyltransferase [Anaerofustis stercorihominis]